MSSAIVEFEAAREHLAIAPFQDSYWMKALKSLAVATGGWGSQLGGWNAPGNVSFDIDIGVSREDVRLWTEIGGADPAENPIIAAGMSLPILQDVADFEILSTDARSKNRLWSEFYVPMDIPHICLTILWREGPAHLVLTVLASARQGPIGNAERRRFRALAKDFRAAAMLSARLCAESTRVLSGALDVVSIAAVIVDSFGRVVAVTKNADEHLRKRNSLTLKGGMLDTVAPQDSATLYRAIHRVTRLPSAAPQSFQVQSIAGPPVSITVAALPVARCDIGFGARAMLVISNAPTSSRAALKMAFGLTAAESEVASLLTEGGQIEDIALRRGVSRETIRSQAKAVYLKTGVRNQIELMAQFLRAQDTSPK